jgi:hypothetical protein
LTPYLKLQGAIQLEVGVKKLEYHQHTSGTAAEFGTLGIVGYFEPHGLPSYSLKLKLQFLE